MNAILAIPFELRLVLLFAIGLILGGWINWGIYWLAYHRRTISPWSPAAPGVSPRHWQDRLPVLGWLALRREAGIHGDCFWIRPLLIELGMGIALAWLYWWEIDRFALLLPQLQAIFLRNAKAAEAAMPALHWKYLAHVVLLSLMTVATFIDIDEKTIPDSITLPGTVIGLLFAALIPQSLLPDMIVNVPPGGLGLPRRELTFLTLTSPNEWPVWLDGAAGAAPLAIGIACLWLWCLGLLPRVWRGRKGWRRGCGILFGRIRRDPFSKTVLFFGVLCSALVSATWWRGGDHWRGLLSALVGMAAAGGLVWAVRIVATRAIGREAMGFGDVTLMSMLGVFLGWQACIMIFFLAPLAAVVVALAQWFLRRRSEIWYGPFLCLAASVVLVFWSAVWGNTQYLFAEGWLIPIVVAACPLLMGLLLPVVRWITGGRLQPRD